MKNKQPLVSIIVPSYNQGRFIGETIESVLSQSHRPLELLIIDGASRDETLKVIRSFAGHPELRCWSEADDGVVDAVNKGFARARGDIGAIQSSDDLYLPDAVATAVEALMSSSDSGLVYGDILKIDAEGRELSRTDLPPFTLEGLLAIETWIPQPSAFFRMDLARSLGGWRNEVPYAPDTDLWLRMAFRREVRKIPVLLAKRRMHETQRNTEGDKIIRDYCRMIDSSPELAAAPRRLQRAASAGKLLMANRFGYGDGYWTKFLRQWRAALIYPPLRRRLPIGTFVPGWGPVRARISRLRSRSLGPAPS